MYLANTLSIMKTETKENRSVSLVVWISISIFFITLFILLGVLLHQTWFLILGIIFGYVIFIYLIYYCVTDSKEVEENKELTELKNNI